ncbi:hypothetical protein T484DRAFT_3100524 [Baffinella frigidus]|nr:hypothetical protein T484DRAFT_3100524 [Cryptophyta sp. CCMP2293]
MHSGRYFSANWHLIAPFLPEPDRPRGSKFAKKLLGAFAEKSPVGGLVVEKAGHATQPKTIVNGKLFPYQLQGLAWLQRQHEMGVGGILGDEMGLGKTLQVVSFFASMHEHKDPARKCGH